MNNKNLPPYNGRLIFFHLEKTAGTAISSWLTKALGSGTVTPQISSNYSSAIKLYGGLYPIISGHMILAENEELDPRYKHVTILREPIDRVVSWLFFLATSQPESAMDNPLVISAKNFIQSDGAKVSSEIHETFNLYVQRLSGIDANQVLYSKKNSIEKAWNRLQYFDVVGLYEDMGDFLGRFSSLIQVPKPESLDSKNKTAHRPKIFEISKMLRERIAEHNQLDLDLYEKFKDRHFSPKEEFQPALGDVSKWGIFDKEIKSATTEGIAFNRLTVYPLIDIVRGEAITFAYTFTTKTPIVNPAIGIHIRDQSDGLAFGTNSQILNTPPLCHSPGEFTATFTIMANLPIGNYNVGFAVVDQRDNAELIWQENLHTFKVIDGPKFFGPGYCPLETTLKINRIETSESR